MEASTISVDLAPQTPAPLASQTARAAPVVKADWDVERERLYQQLDDKVQFIDFHLPVFSC